MLIYVRYMLYGLSLDTEVIESALCPMLFVTSVALVTSVSSAQIFIYENA